MNLIPPRESGRHALAAALGATDSLLGLTLLLSPASRVSSPAFDAAKHWMPIHAWGAILLFIGAWILTMTLARRHPGLGLAAAAGWFGFFVTTLAVAAHADTRVAWTGCITYGGIVVIHLLCAVRHVR